MDLSQPIRSVIPSASGPVLVALVRAGRPLSGRQIAALVDGEVGRSRVNSVLGELTESGLVLAEPQPPSVLYSFNRAHVAAPMVEALADLRGALIDRIRTEVAGWARPADAVWIFGSAARGDGSVSSDIDILVIRPIRLHASDERWRAQVSDLSAKVRAWSGNACEVLELTRRELTGHVAKRSRLARELRRDAITVGGESPEAMLA